MPGVTIQLPNNWRPRPYQMKAWTYLERGGRHAELVWHRRAGKDDLALHKTATSMYQRPGNYWHMLPKANQARKALWEAVNPHTGKRRIDEAFPEPIRMSCNDHEMIIRVSSGATWQVVGSDNFDSLVGSPPVGLVFSEWALCNPASWAYLSPIMAENKGWVIFNTTPRGRNHAYRSYISSKAQMQAGKDCFAQVLTVDDTPVFSKEGLEEERKNLVAIYGREFGQSIFEQEYHCSFEASNLGAVLGRWLTSAERENRIGAFPVDPAGAPIEISSDIGFRDTSVWWFWQPTFGGFRIVACDSDSGLDADEWIDRLKKKCDDLGADLGKIWLPPDAKAKTFHSRHSAMERFLKAFGASVVKAVPASKKQDQINAARYVIEHCQFDEAACREGIEGLADWHFVYDEELKDFSKEPEHSWSSHYGDAFAYGALMMRNREMDEKKVDPLAAFLASRPTLDDLWETQPRPSGRI